MNKNYDKDEDKNRLRIKKDKDMSKNKVGIKIRLWFLMLPFAHQVIGSLKQPNWLYWHMQMAIQRAKYTLQKHPHRQTPAQKHTLICCSCGAVTWSFWQLQRRAWGLIITFSPSEEKNISFRLQLSLVLSVCLRSCTGFLSGVLGSPGLLKWFLGGPQWSKKFNTIEFSWNDPSYRMYKNG